MKRVFLIVLDSCGIGAMPDAKKFGDKGVNTLAACATSNKLHIPNLIKAGLGNIDGVFRVSKESSAVLVIRCAISRSSDAEKPQNPEKPVKRLA